MFLKVKQKILQNKTLVLAVLFLAIMFLQAYLRTLFVKADDYYSNTYALRVETGVTPGDTIGSFVVVYQDPDGITRRAYINPHDGELDYSIKLGTKSDTSLLSQRRKIMNEVFGYTLNGTSYTSSGNEVKAFPALQQNSLNTYFFTTNYPVQKIISIGILTGNAKIDTKKWSCYSMSLYKVNTIKDPIPYGYMSSDFELGFDGKLLETMKFTNNNSDIVADFTFAQNSLVYLYDSTVKNPSDAPSAGTTRAWLEQSTDPYSNMTGAKDAYTIKVDIADTYLAGFESYVRKSQAEGKLSDIKPAEILVLKIDYITKSKSLKSVGIPVLTSALSYAIESGAIKADTALADLMPQGGSLSFPITLPSFDHIQSANLYYVTKESGTANDICLETLVGMKSNSDATVQKKHADFYAATKNDTISVTGIQIFKLFGSVGVSTDGTAALRAKIKSGADLVCYANSGDLKGYVLNPGAGRSLTFKTREKDEKTSVAFVPDNRERYLLEVKTSNLINADTTSDILAVIKYLDDDDQEREHTFHFMEAAQSFYGYWPDAKGAEAGYQLCMQRGASYYAILDLEKVQKIYGLKLKNEGEDSWMTAGVAVYRIDDNSQIGSIFYRWNNNANQASVIHGRDVHGHLIDFETSLKEELAGDYEAEIVQVAGIGNTGTEPDIDNPGGDTPGGDNPGGDNPGGEDNPGGDTPGGRPTPDETAHGIYFDGEGEKEINFTSIEVNTVTDNRSPYFEYMYDMPYSVATSNFGFDSRRVLYDVDVLVGYSEYGISSNGLKYDDCGSTNFFYFQLVFEKGKSAYVQANQQLSGDSFRSGCHESFKVYVNQDYGALQAINIVPEVSVENGNPYDKLNIEKITVSRKTENGLSQTFETDNIQWVGIDYSDNGEKAAYHSASQLVRTFLIASEHNTANILVSISYDSLPEGIAQFQGVMSADVTYRSVTGKIETKPIDVVQLMHEFNGTTNNVTLSDLTTTNGQSKLAKSDPNLMFRPNSTDRFIFSAPDIKYVERIEFYPQNTTETTNGIRITNVDLAVIESGSIDKNRSMNRFNEYIIEDGQYRDVAFTQGKFSVDISKGVKQYIDIKFENDPSSSISESIDSVKPFIITRTPISENDTVNVYAYVTPSKYDLSGYSVDGIIYFDDNRGISRKSPSAFRLTTVVDEKGESHQVYCCEDLSVRNFATLKDVSLVAYGKGGDVAIDYIIVQHIRNNVVIGNYKASYASSGPSICDYPVSTNYINTVDNNQGYQEITIQLGSDMDDKEIILNKEKYDLAVALDYMLATGNQDKEFHTANFYLTDYGIKSIRPGEVIKIKVHNANIGKITGLSISSTGFLKADIKAATVGIYTPETNSNSTAYVCSGWYSFDANRVIRNETARFNVTSDRFDSAETWSTLTMRIKTLRKYNAENGNFGTDVGLSQDQMLQMIITYEQDGEARELIFNNIAANLTSGDFTADNTAVFVFMAKGIRPDNIKKVEYRPYDNDENTNVIWGVDTIDVSFGDGTTKKDTLHVEPQKVLYENDENDAISFAKVIISARVDKVDPVFNVGDNRFIEYTTLLEEIAKITQTNGKKMYITDYSPLHVYSININMENSSMGYKVDEDRGIIFYRSGEEDKLYFSILNAKEGEEKSIRIISKENVDCFLDLTFVIESKIEYEMSAAIQEVDAKFSTKDPTLITSETVLENLGEIDRTTENKIFVKNHSATKIYKIKLDMEDTVTGYKVEADRGMIQYYSKEEDTLYFSFDGKVGEEKKVKITAEGNEECYLEIIFEIETKEKFEVSVQVQSVAVALSGNQITGVKVLNDFGTLNAATNNRFQIKEDAEDNVFCLIANVDKSEKGYRVEADRDFVKLISSDDKLYYVIEGKAGEKKTIRIISEENEECYLDMIFVIEPKEEKVEPTEAPTEAPTTLPTESTTTEASTEAPTEAPTTLPTESTTTEATTEASTEAPTEAPTEEPTEPALEETEVSSEAASSTQA